MVPEIGAVEPIESRLFLVIFRLSLREFFLPVRIDNVLNRLVFSKSKPCGTYSLPLKIVHLLPQVRIAQQKFIAAPEARRQVIWEMDKLAMNDAAYLILHCFDLQHVRWSFVKGWTITPDIRSTNARLDYVWLDLPEVPYSKSGQETQEHGG